MWVLGTQLRSSGHWDQRDTRKVTIKSHEKIPFGSGAQWRAVSKRSDDATRPQTAPYTSSWLAFTLAKMQGDNSFHRFKTVKFSEAPKGTHSSRKPFLVFCLVAVISSSCNVMKDQIVQRWPRAAAYLWLCLFWTWSICELKSQRETAVFADNTFFF